MAANLNFESEFDAAKARGMRDSTYLSEAMCKLYAKSDELDRANMRKAIGSWLLSDDLDRRYVAMWVIRKFQLSSLIPELKKFSESGTNKFAVDPFDRSKATRLIADLQNR